MITSFTCFKFEKLVNFNKSLNHNSEISYNLTTCHSIVCNHISLFSDISFKLIQFFNKARVSLYVSHFAALSFLVFVVLVFFFQLLDHNFILI